MPDAAALQPVVWAHPAPFVAAYKSPSAAHCTASSPAAHVNLAGGDGGGGGGGGGGDDGGGL